MIVFLKRNHQISSIKNLDADDPMTPFKLNVFGYLVFWISEWFLGFVIFLIFKHK